MEYISLYGLSLFMLLSSAYIMVLQLALISISPFPGYVSHFIVGRWFYISYHLVDMDCKESFISCWCKILAVGHVRTF